MNMKIMAKLSAIIVIALFFQVSNCDAGKSEDLKYELERSYNNFTTAIKTKNHELLKSSTTSYLYNRVRNAVISTKRQFPENFFENEIDDFSNFKFIASTQKGSTANLIYFGEAGFGMTSKGEPYRIFRVIKFTKEAGSWKNNGILEFGDEDFVYSPNSTEEENLTYLKSTDAIPDGIIKPTPKPCDQPDYFALVLIKADEIDTVVNINGYDYEKKHGEHTMTHVIWGGLKEGANTLKINSILIENATDPKLTVTIRSSLDINQDSIEIFKYERILGENTFEQTINVSKDVFINITKQ
jgi:hypothetical protein